MARTVLAEGPVVADTIVVELVQPSEYPDVIQVLWPSVPTVCDPRKFAVMATSVISVMDRAMAEVQKRGGASV